MLKGELKMSNDKLFEKKEVKKLMSVSLTTGTIEKIDTLVKSKKLEGFKVNKSVLVERAILNFLTQLENNEKSLFGNE